MNSPATPPRATWAQSLRVYLEPASLRMLVLGFAAGLPLLLVLGTLSFRLREAGINRATISFLGWVGLAYGFKWVWAPLVDRLPIPLLTRLFGQRRSWLLLAQIGVMLGLVGMALANPLEGVGGVVRMAVLVAFCSATQDIALDAFRIESASVERQAALASTYQTGYRLAMICAGAGVLKIASWVESSATAATVTAATTAASAAAAIQPAYSNHGWQVAYLAMAGVMLVGVLTVLFSQEPAQRKSANNAPVEDPAWQQALQNIAARGVAISGLLAVPLWVLAIVVTVAQAAKMEWAVSLDAASGGWLMWVLLGIAAAFTAWVFAPSSPRWQPKTNGSAHRLLARGQASFVSPFVDFFQRYRWPALLILGLIGIYRISDVVMGNMANQFYVDMQFTKDQVALASGIFGVVFTLFGTFVGGLLAMRFGVMRVLFLGAVLAAVSNLLFAWMSVLPAVANDVWAFTLFGESYAIPRALTLVLAADNISGGIASAAFIAYLSGLTSIRYSATQYALFSSIMLLLPKFIAGFSGTFVNHYGYANFFIATALLGVPVLLLVWLAGRVLPVGADAPD